MVALDIKDIRIKYHILFTIGTARTGGMSKCGGEKVESLALYW
jgi:hypothetical protein